MRISIFQIAIVCYCKLEQSFLNTKVELKSTLGTHDLRQEIEIKATAVRDSSIYQFVIPSDLTGNVAIIKASKQGKDLVVEPEGVENNSQIWNIKLNKVVQSTEIVLLVEIVLTKISQPFPKILSQFDADQLYIFKGNTFFYSAYKTESQRQVIKLPVDKEPASMTEPVKIDGKELIYGPYINIAPFSHQDLKVHFYNNEAALIATTYIKTIEVAYARSLLHVQEDFEVHHQGAKLKGHFSQVDFKLGKNRIPYSNVVTGFKSIVPATVTDVYYKDLVGNITTSNLRYERKKAVLELRPRYPLYGGWRTTWFHGYTLPQEPFLVQVGQTDDYVMKMSIRPTVKGLSIDKATLKVILPEDATNIRIECPYESKKSEFITYSYLDTTGRPTLSFDFTNIVDEFDKLVEIRYTYPQVMLLKKPLVVTSCIAAIVIILFLVSRLDLSIVLDSSAILQKKTDVSYMKLSKLLAKECELLKKVDAGLLNYKEDKDTEKFQATQLIAFAEIESCHTDLSALSSETSDLNLLKIIKSLGALLKERLQIIKKRNDLITTHFTAELKGAVSDEQSKKMNDALEESDWKRDQVDMKITAQLIIQ